MRGSGPSPRLGLVASLVVAIVATVSAPATAVDVDRLELAFEPIVSEGLEIPLFVTDAGDGTGDLYVIEKRGRIRVIRGGTMLQEEPVLDITDRVLIDHIEQGLLGLAFHPSFEENGRFFVNYTRVPDGATVIDEYVISDGLADPGASRTILTVPQPQRWHQAGTLRFDAEGYLWTSLGDGGRATNGQDPDTLHAKLLRLDVDGEPYPPADADGKLPAGSARPEVMAMGFRNPYRFSIDRQEGHVYIGDVGHLSWEEINVIPEAEPGRNFGWRDMEGPGCGPPRRVCDTDEHVPPAIAYQHGDGGAVIGGHVYRGSAMPELDGVYIFGDWVSGAVFAASTAALLDGAALKHTVGNIGPGRLLSFGEDEDGELYVVDGAGAILRISVAP